MHLGTIISTKCISLCHEMRTDENCKYQPQYIIRFHAAVVNAVNWLKFANHTTILACIITVLHTYFVCSKFIRYYQQRQGRGHWELAAAPSIGRCEITSPNAFRFVPRCISDETRWIWGFEIPNAFRRTGMHLGTKRIWDVTQYGCRRFVKVENLFAGKIVATNQKHLLRKIGIICFP
jgi:hypothetical protein